MPEVTADWPGEVHRCAPSAEGLGAALDQPGIGNGKAVCLVDFEAGGRCAATLDYLNRQHPGVPIGLVVRKAQRPEAFALLRSRKVDRIVPVAAIESGIDIHIKALADHGCRLANLAHNAETFSGKTLFITGATGFLGGHFLRYLLRCTGARVIALTRSNTESAYHGRLAHLAQIHPGRICCVEGDVREPGLGMGPSLASTIAGEVDSIWHFAADTRFEPLLRDELFRSNLFGTRNVVQFARSLPGLRHFYHVSTAYVAGDQHPESVVPEARLARPISFKNPYEESKYEAECAVAESGLPATIFRPSIILGERVSGLCDGQTVYKVAQLLRLARLSGQRSSSPAPQRFRVVVDPETTKNLVSADDVVCEMIRIASSASAPGGYHHLTHPEPTIMADLIAVIAGLLNIPEYEAVSNLDGAALSTSEAVLQRISGVFKPYMLNSDPVFARACPEGWVPPMDQDSLEYLLQSFFEQHYGSDFQPVAVPV